MTVPKNGLAGTSTQFDPVDTSDKVEFTITIENPCRTTTVADLTISGADSSSPYSKQITDGSTGSVTFTRPLNPVETDTNISSVCGSTSYSIHSDNGGTNFSYNADWAVITTSGNTMTLTIDTTKDLTLIDNEASKTIPVYIKATLDDYTSYNRESYTLINIVIAEVTCDCSALAWDNPSSGIDVGSVTAGTGSQSKTLAPPVPNTSATSTNNAFQKCYENSNSCPTTGAYTDIQYSTDGVTGTTLPSWITWSDASSITQTVSINPADGTVIGTHHLIATFNPTNGLDKTYQAMTFTVTCEVTSWTAPSAPTSPTFDLSYAVFETPLTIDISTLTYTQSPACGYTYTNNYSWSTLPAYISEAPAGSGSIVVSSSNL